MKRKIVASILLFLIAASVVSLLNFNVGILPDGQAEEARETRRNIVIFLIGSIVVPLIVREAVRRIRHKVHRNVMKKYE